MHADFFVLQVVQLGHGGGGGHGDELAGLKVRVREVHGLLALVGDGDGRHQHVAVALGQRGEGTFPRGADKLHVQPGFLGRSAQHVDVEADDFAFFVLEFKRCVGGVGAHGDDLGRRCRGCRCRRSGLGGHRGGCGFAAAAEEQAHGQGGDGLDELAFESHGKCRPGRLVDFGQGRIMRGGAGHFGSMHMPNPG